MTKPKADLKAPLNHHTVQGTPVQLLLPVVGKETAEVINNDPNDPSTKAPGTRRFCYSIQIKVGNCVNLQNGSM
jgi:hypothetical protein